MKKGFKHYGAYVSRVQKIPTRDGWLETVIVHEINFTMPASAEHTDEVMKRAEEVAHKRWKNCWVTETWRCR